jgi:hypothetical protein
MARTATGSGSRRRRARELPPEFLPGATEFTADGPLGDPVWLVRQLKRFPDILDPLLAATTLGRRRGRRRLAGDWALIKIAMVASGEVDVETFCRRYASSQVWREAGFAAMPTVQTAWNRLTELEPHYEAFVEAANKLIRRAVKREPKIARNVWVDGTAFETHAILEHACEDPDECRKHGGAPQLVRASADEIREERHAEAAKAEEATLKPEGVSTSAAAAKPACAPRRRKPYRYIELGPAKGYRHRFRTLDPDAGARMYGGAGKRRKKKFWFGGITQTAVSVYVGAPLAINTLPASAQEYNGWPELFEKLIDATGAKPEAVLMDRAYSLQHVFKHNTRRGVATVSPWRKHRHIQDRAQLDGEIVDRHGVPRCRHCGGPGDSESPGLGLYFARAEPRIRFRCQLGILPSCAQSQSIACSKSWTLLVPLSRRTETYHALSRSSKNLERVFRHWRARYTVAGQDIDSRPKRPGLAWQHLRSSVALLIEWFRIGLRHGWLGSHRTRNTAHPKPLRAGSRLERVLASRRKHGLDLPYGRQAIRAGLILDPGGGGPPPGPSAASGPIPF